MKKTKNLVFVVTVLVLLNSGSGVMAVSEGAQERKELRQEVRQENKELKEEIKENREEARSTITTQKKTVWTEMKRKQVGMITQRIQTELDLRYKIILKLKEKIGERITKKSATNDMASASAKLKNFTDSQYQSDMTLLKAKLTEITSSDTPKSLLPGVREAANKVRVSLRSMHLFLVEVMKLVATAPKLNG